MIEIDLLSSKEPLCVLYGKKIGKIHTRYVEWGRHKYVGMDIEFTDGTKCALTSWGCDEIQAKIT